MDIEKMHKSMYYPACRVSSNKALGSGTVIYSELVPNTKDEYETYVLTNEHVIDSNITIEKKWSTLVKRDVKIDVLSDVQVEFYEYENTSWEDGIRANKGQIMCYDKDRDLGLLKLKTTSKFPYIAKLLPRGNEKDQLRIFQPVICIGCGLGNPPVITGGMISGFNYTINNYPYMLTTASSIYGNSGGAIYLVDYEHDSYQFIGIPSRIAVTGIFGSDAITHLSYSIPTSTIYNFLEDNIFQFIFNKSFNSNQCEEIRKEKRKHDENKMAIDDSRDPENTSTR